MRATILQADPERHEFFTHREGGNVFAVCRRCETFAPVGTWYVQPCPGVLPKPTELTIA